MYIMKILRLARHRCGTTWWWHGNVETGSSICYIKRRCCDIYCCDINCAFGGYNKNTEYMCYCVYNEMRFVNIHERKYVTETVVIIVCICTQSMIIFDLTFGNEYVYQ